MAGNRQRAQPDTQLTMAIVSAQTASLTRIGRVAATQLFLNSLVGVDIDFAESLATQP